MIRQQSRRGAAWWRARAAIPGLLVHQDGSSHEWVAGAAGVLIVTMDDATSEGVLGLLRGGGEDLVELSRGARDAREAGLVQHPVHGPGSHYWAPAAGGKVCRANPTQFGRAIGELGIEMIPSYSTKSRGRSQRWFGTVQGRLPRELALGGITGTSDANGLSSRVVLAADEPAVRRSPSGDTAGPEAKTLVTTGRGAGICGPDGTSGSLAHPVMPPGGLGGFFASAGVPWRRPTRPPGGSMHRFSRPQGQIRQTPRSPTTPLVSYSGNYRRRSCPLRCQRL